MQSAGGTTTTLGYSVTGDTLDLLYTRQQLLGPDVGGDDPDTQRLYDLEMGVVLSYVTFEHDSRALRANGSHNYCYKSSWPHQSLTPGIRTL